MARRCASSRPIATDSTWSEQLASLPPPPRSRGTCCHCTGKHASARCNLTDLTRAQAVAFQVELARRLAEVRAVHDRQAAEMRAAVELAVIGLAA